MAMPQESCFVRGLTAMTLLALMIVVLKQHSHDADDSYTLNPKP